MTEEEWERKKREISILIEECEQDAVSAIRWYQEWRERQLSFRCQREKSQVT